MGQDTTILSVIIPVFNERATIAEVVRRVDAVQILKTIIVVDDHSTDGTRELLGQLQDHYSNLIAVHHDKNRGKGAAIRTGLGFCDGRIVIIQDADLESDPRDYAKILRPILAGKADVVYGSRFLSSSEHRVLSFWHSVGNMFLTLLCNMFSNINLTDMETGYKAFRREVFQDLIIREDRFGFEPEITIKVARYGWRIYEVSISYSGRTYAEGKKISVWDGFSALRCIVEYGLSVPRGQKIPAVISPSKAELAALACLSEAHESPIFESSL